MALTFKFYFFFDSCSVSLVFRAKVARARFLIGFCRMVNSTRVYVRFDIHAGGLIMLMARSPAILSELNLSVSHQYSLRCISSTRFIYTRTARTYEYYIVYIALLTSYTANVYTSSDEQFRVCGLARRVSESAANSDRSELPRTSSDRVPTSTRRHALFVPSSTVDRQFLSIFDTISISRSLY